MKKFILAIGLIALVAAACNNTTAPTSPTPAPSPTPSTPTPPTTQTYSNSTYGFTFTYPVSMNFVTPTYANLEDKVVQLQIPQSTYPGTNFGDAAFDVSASFAKTQAACLALTPPEGGDGFKTQTTINGQTFFTTAGNGVGAGNIYTQKVYRAFVGNQTCVELVETIHTGNIGNYPTGTVTEVDQTPIWAQLDTITQSFKFNQ